MNRFLIVLLLIGCNGKQTGVVLWPEEFDTRYKATENAILLDVRTPEEVAAGKIAGAINIVWDDDFVNKITNYLEHKPIFVYCGSGIRSSKASVLLKENGYDQVFELRGGLKAWKEADMPIE